MLFTAQKKQKKAQAGSPKRRVPFLSARVQEGEPRFLLVGVYRRSLLFNLEMKEAFKLCGHVFQW